MLAIQKIKASVLLLSVFTCTSLCVHAQQFTKHVLTNDFLSEGVAVADVNKDGKPDIIAGAYWFEAPNWTKHAISADGPFNPSNNYSNSFLDYAMDVDQDGWVDMIRFGWPGEEVVWYENPKNKPGLWVMHTIQSHVGIESPALVDIDGDGRLDLLCNSPEEKAMIWFKSPTKKGDTTWTKYYIYKGDDIPTGRYTHGLGVGDMNGDGRPDVLVTQGWWETPKDPTQPNWVFHKADLGPDCAQMYVYDVNGDGNVDVISSSSHNYGIWWHEQVKDAAGNVTWKLHEIYKGFSESHSLAFTDINGDGHPDLVTGKRYFAENGRDTGSYEPSVIYWFEFKPGKNPTWIPHQIDDNSGVGLEVLVKDMNKDGLPDIVVSNKKGVFWFEQKR